MMRGKRHLYQCKHPFNEYPFEAFFCNSWQSVEFIRIKDGIIAVHLDDNRCLIEEKRPFSNVRVKSRRTNLSDCTCFLRPSIDVCVLSASRNKENSDEDNEDPVWVDARIISVERKPHETGCSCQFYVKFYVDGGPLGSERGTLSKETEPVGIDQIGILQRLEKEACEYQPYRWYYSEDCTSLQKTKLFLGRFLADLSWFLVTSVLKQIAFDVRSVQNKIVYQILGDDDDASCSSNSDNHLNVINFIAEDDILTSRVVQFVLDETVEALPACDEQEPKPLTLTFYEVMDLRRSKRRNVQPDRFLGSDVSPESNVGWVRMLPYRTDQGEEEEDEDMHLPISCLRSPQGKSRSTLRELKSGMASLSEEINERAIVPVPSESEPIACYEHDYPAKNSRNCSRGNDVSSSKFYITSSSVVQRRNTPKVERTEFKSKWKGKAPKYCMKGLSYSEPWKSTTEFEFMQFESRWGGRTSNKKDKSKNFFDMEDTWFESNSWGKPTNKRVQRNRYHSISTKQNVSSERVSYKKASLSAGAYNRLINSYMKNIDHTVSNEEPSIIDQWNQFKASKTSEPKPEVEESSSEEEEEMTEMEMLWKEMELSLASAYILENNESSNADASAKSTEMPTEGCQHEFTTDEEIGIICRLCNFVSTEIKYVTAPFVQQKGWTVDNNKTGNEEYSAPKPDEDEGLNIFCNQESADTPLSEENDNVWALIPEHKTKLRFHQKKAFEFLWKNIAGSLEPALMEKAAKKTGGCVISHTPGAGKTFLIIAFLVSYLRLFPGKRPLVLAPKTTLYTWYKEFIKWKISLPVHLIHGRRTYKVGKEQRLKFSQGGPRPSHDVMHVLDCLEKIQKWHAQPSVLVMGYTSFLTLMREDSRFAHRKFMAKVLRESPGILVLDEGHNPRSTKSRLRKVLMKVETDYRILLSGTLFQNNFCEYFNTLCLARPKFINEVLKVLDPKFKGKKKGKKKARHLLEARARKFFIDHIARKIDLEGDERMEGLNMLRKVTHGFIDVYESGSSDGLPGLQIYTLMMNATEVQHKVLVKLRNIMEKYHGYPLELELLITLASIHPSLVRTSNCAHKFFQPEELMELDKYKYEFRRGSKVMFVLNLVTRVVKNEKVLIFCHNIAPIQLFSELFQNVFRWQKGKEILILTGDLELFDRGRIMDKFEEPGGPSRVLLASITACAEGISLTAASRVIMLDSEWNPSKTKQAIARAFRPGQQKMVYVYQLLASKTLEEDKYKRTTWKEWVSCMIFSEAFVEDPSRWQAEKIEDEVLREIVEEDRVKSFHAIMKNEKASTG